MAARAYYSSTPFASQEQDLQRLLPSNRTSSKFPSDESSRSIPLQFAPHGQIPPYSDFEDLKEAEIADRVRHSQQRNATCMITFMPASENAHPKTARVISYPLLVHIRRSPRSHRAHPPQVPQHTDDLSHCHTFQRPKHLTYTVGPQHARMADIHVLWCRSRLRTT
jgi:hypothetical protein